MDHLLIVFSEGQECSKWRGQLAAGAEAEDALSLGGPGKSHEIHMTKQSHDTYHDNIT